MKKLLVIRSVSFQQLDNVLAVMRTKFPGFELHVLTHQHGRKIANKYAYVDKVLTYPYQGSFSLWKPLTGVDVQYYDALVVPIANLSGAAFTNVQLFSLRQSSGDRYLCNLAGEIRKISVGGIVFRAVVSAFYHCVAILLGSAIAFVIILTVVAVFTLNGLRKS